MYIYNKIYVCRGAGRHTSSESKNLPYEVIQRLVRHMMSGEMVLRRIMVLDPAKAKHPKHKLELTIAR